MKRDFFHYVKNIICVALILLLIKASLDITDNTNRDVEERYLILQCLIYIGVGVVIGVLLGDITSIRKVPKIWSITMGIFLGINTGFLLIGAATRHFLYLLGYLNDAIYYLFGIEASYTVYIFVFCMQFVVGYLTGTIVYNKIIHRLQHRTKGK